MARRIKTLIKSLFRLLLLVVLLVAVSFLGLRMSRGVLYDESGASKRLKVASVAMTCDIDPAVNRRRILDTAHAVKQEHPEVDLIMFGETITGWYAKPPESQAYHRRIAEGIPGETTTLLAAAARELRTHLSFGISEASDGKIYNSQVLIDPDGRIVAVHRKVNLQGAGAFAPGTVPVTMVEIKGIRTAIIICSDIQSAAVRSALRDLRPELVLGSLASPSDPEWFISGLIAKMIGAWILTANRYGQDGAQFFDGQMIVADPLGDLRLKVKDRAQHVFFDIGFDDHPSSVRGWLRTLYRWESLGLHLVENVGLIVASPRK